jgi:hypothetical protein
MLRARFARSGLDLFLRAALSLKGAAQLSLLDEITPSFR